MRKPHNGKGSINTSPTTGGHPMRLKTLIITCSLLIFAAPALAVPGNAARTFKADPIKTETEAKQIEDSISNIMQELDAVTQKTSDNLDAIARKLEQSINSYKSSEDGPRVKKAYADALASTCESLDSVATLPERLIEDFNKLVKGFDSRINGLADYENSLSKRVDAAKIQLKSKVDKLLSVKKAMANVNPNELTFEQHKALRNLVRAYNAQARTLNNLSKKLTATAAMKKHLIKHRRHTGQMAQIIQTVSEEVRDIQATMAQRAEHQAEMLGHDIFSRQLGPLNALPKQMMQLSSIFQKSDKIHDSLSATEKIIEPVHSQDFPELNINQIFNTQDNLEFLKNFTGKE